jgi:hypothetical protein
VAARMTSPPKKKITSSPEKPSPMRYVAVIIQIPNAVQRTGIRNLKMTLSLNDRNIWNKMHNRGIMVIRRNAMISVFDESIDSSFIF